MGLIVRRRSALALALTLSLAITGCRPPSEAAATVASAALERATPESVGISSERLTRLHDAMQSFVDEGHLAGITTMIARHGKIADFRTYGRRDVEAGDAMAEDAIFRIASMSKPVTAVALMMLYEEGKFRLSDPVDRYIPELADLQVAASWGPYGPELVEADHPMTIRELMTHTAGLAYGLGNPHPVDSLYAERGIYAYNQTLADMIDKLAELPLRQQPGSLWTYSIAVDVQGRLAEVLSGQPFDEFLQERLFGPLGMVDTGFHVPARDHGRFAQLYEYGEDGGLAVADLVATSGPGEPRRYLDPPTFFSGGAGLVSTTMDYMRFCQMLLNGGELDGVRILSPSTVDLIRSDHLPYVGVAAANGPGKGLGFGLGFAVTLDPGTDPVEGRDRGYENGSVGEYYWGGAYGTWFWIDPAEDLVFIGMIQQRSAGRPDVRSLSRQLTYQAIVASAADGG